MVTVKYCFLNPRVIRYTHKYLYKSKRFYSFEEAKKFIEDLPLTIELTIFEGRRKVITKLETNCYIICEGKKFPQIQGEFYKYFENNNRDYEVEYDGDDSFLILSNYTLPEDYINWFRQKFLK